ncbi:hypothetical protein CEXT_81871 [Caerostris extrusa]|uniref:Uncharacterized protein n=1 Tax=Caerostris extrusa TaxID=172846 RepID=A0AAV4NK17_CAEEX|nr:hypothetical protein CEXT_81871 [Caerostris extrusa]
MEQELKIAIYNRIKKKKKTAPFITELRVMQSSDFLVDAKITNDIRLRSHSTWNPVAKAILLEFYSQGVVEKLSVKGGHSRREEDLKVKILEKRNIFY